MRMLNFAKRNIKELVRDPLGFVFAIALPMLLLFVFMQFDIPNEAYEIENFTPGIVVFGLSFISMFTAMLVSKDRTTSLLVRLGISPMRSWEYIFGYAVAIVPIVVLQSVLFYILAVILGLKFGVWIIFASFISVPVSVLFIMTGILIGSLMGDKASSGASSIIVQLVCFTSGMYFPREMLGKGFATLCDFLPFAPALDIVKGIANNDLSIITPHDIGVFLIYTAVVTILATFIFKRKMTSDGK